MSDDEDDMAPQRQAAQLTLFDLPRGAAPQRHTEQLGMFELPRDGEAEAAARRHAARRGAPEPPPNDARAEVPQRRSAAKPASREAEGGKRRRFTPRREPEPDTSDDEADLAPRHGTDWDRIPDVRDGLTRVERVILVCLQKAQAEKRDRMVSTAMLYGRVVEHVDISVPEFQRILQRLVGIR